MKKLLSIGFVAIMLVVMCIGVSAADPTILFDFGEDEACSENMGANSNSGVQYYGEEDYYVFIATSNDPYVSLDASAGDVEDVVWAKVCVKNPSPATAIELFGHTNDRGLTGSECTHIEIEPNCDEWRDYIIYIPTENVKTVNAYKDPQYAIEEPYWEGTVEWIRLDPMWQEGNDGSDSGGSMETGDEIWIDYIAFFSNEDDAKAFRADHKHGGAANEVEPTILFDFGEDEACSENMGANSNSGVQYYGENDYYVFIATSNDPYVSLDASADDVDDVVWAKVCVKNPSAATAIELFGHTNDRGLTGSECTHIEIDPNSNEWKDYIIYIPTENVKTVNAYKDPQYAIEEPYWEGTVEWIRLDPMWQEGNDGSDSGGSMETGDEIWIDYIAFFSNEADAKAFRSGHTHAAVETAVPETPVEAPVETTPAETPVEEAPVETEAPAEDTTSADTTEAPDDTAEETTAPEATDTTAPATEESSNMGVIIGVVVAVVVVAAIVAGVVISKKK